VLDIVEEFTMSEAPTNLIEDVLRQELGPHGLDHVEVKADEDHAGDPALFITAVLKPNTQLIGAKIYSDAHKALNDALLNEGERRFPYLFLRHPDDEREDPMSKPSESILR
jgi:hypothetical protein